MFCMFLRPVCGLFQMLLTSLIFCREEAALYAMQKKIWNAIATDIKGQRER